MKRIEFVASEDELVELCREWQERLSLRDWDVHIRVCRARNLPIEESEGTVHWCLPKKTAGISILDPVDFDEHNLTTQDMERTLVHELLHLHFASLPFEAGTPEDTTQEQAIHALSLALVALKREAESAKAE